ncbi:MAG: ATP-dependent Clp protease ATP-binding subunit [Chloroflexota bacterium]|nr:ATP-dependent Clp protease ATP-binding subunit [Chloroflexota bacterium]
MSRTNQYTKEARLAISNAREEAQQLRHRTIGTEHLLLGVLRIDDPIIIHVFSAFNVDIGHLRQAIELIVGQGHKAIISDPVLAPVTRSVLALAEREAVNLKAEMVGVEHLLLGLLSEREEGAGITIGVLESFGIYLDATRQLIIKLLGMGREQASATAEYQARYNLTPMLNLVSRDLTMAAMSGMLDPLIGREVELERVMQILTRRSKNNPVLIGHAGVGKTAIAEGLALRILQGQVPEILLNRRVVSLDTGMLTAGTKFRGDFEERLKGIMQEIINAQEIIIVIDELHTLVNSGVTEGSIGAANLFKPMLARGEFQCIGATTLDDYRKSIEADPALERRFQPVLVPETNEAETLEILRATSERYAEFHRVTITDEALVTAVRMSSRYIPNRAQPDKAIDLLDETAARMCVQRAAAPAQVNDLRKDLALTRKAKDDAIEHLDFPAALNLRHSEQHMSEALQGAELDWSIQREASRPVVDEQQIAEVVSRWTGIPVTQISTNEAERLLHLEEELHRRVIGQHDAVEVVARAARRARTNMRERRRPIGSFIFVGPTGVGKTELARALAEVLFGNEGALIKLDMSEFMESHHASRLIGSPPGYIGYDQGGQLTEAVRRQPYSVVLFDEIEKAHPQVFDLLLQILDDGCLTDARGQTVDFKHTIVILTSNAGSMHQLSSAMNFAPAKLNQQERSASDHQRMEAQTLSALKDLFKPELLNRIDEIVVFHTLELAQLHEIADLMIDQTRQRLAALSIELQVTVAAREILVQRGYEPAYGARPLRRTIQSMLDDALAEAILQGTLHAGDTVVADSVDNTIRVHTLVPA